MSASGTSALRCESGARLPKVRVQGFTGKKHVRVGTAKPPDRSGLVVIRPEIIAARPTEQFVRRVRVVLRVDHPAIVGPLMRLSAGKRVVFCHRHSVSCSLDGVSLNQAMIPVSGTDSRPPQNAG